MKKFKPFLCIVSSLFIIIILCLTTYTIDKNRISEEKDPIFVIKTQGLKDGGSIEYTGLGYRIIKWNIVSDDGFYTGYEVSTFPNLKYIYEGPTIDLKYIPVK